MPLRERASIEDQADIVTARGLRRQVDAEIEIPQTSSRTRRIYRGHLIVELERTDAQPKSA